MHRTAVGSNSLILTSKVHSHDFLFENRQRKCAADARPRLDAVRSDRGRAGLLALLYPLAPLDLPGLKLPSFQFLRLAYSAAFNRCGGPARN